MEFGGSRLNDFNPSTPQVAPSNPNRSPGCPFVIPPTSTSKTSTVEPLRLNRRAWSIAMGLLTGVASLLAGALRAEDPSRLAERLQRTLAASPKASPRWGAVVTRLDGTVLFSTNAFEAFIPASNTKLFIGAMALDQLGPAARLDTPIHVDRLPDANGVLRSDLWVVGQGDPTLNTSPRPGTWDDALLPLVDRWHSKGLRRVIGDLVMCDAALRIPDYGPGWDDEDRAEWYGAPVSAFVVNDNTFRLVAGPAPQDATDIPFHLEPPLPSLSVDWRVTVGTNTSHRIRYVRRAPDARIRFDGRWARGAHGWSAELAVADPARTFGELLKRTLERRGITVTGSVRSVHSDQGCPSLAWDHWSSDPLSRRLALCLKPSQNLHAQLLLAEVGRLAEREALRTGTTPHHRRHDAWGLSRLPGFLERAGIPEGAVRLEEGSGLSRANRVTPAATATLLRSMALHPHRQAWKGSLPVGGVDGTLRHRFKTAPTQGNVRAKTGSLRGVHALGGYVTSVGGDELVFAIYANEAQSDPQARVRMDQFVEVLAGAGPSPPPGATPLIPPR